MTTSPAPEATQETQDVAARVAHTTGQMIDRMMLETLRRNTGGWTRAVVDSLLVDMTEMTQRVATTDDQTGEPASLGARVTREFHERLDPLGVCIAITLMASALNEASGDSPLRRAAIRQLFNGIVDDIDGGHTFTVPARFWQELGPHVREAVLRAHASHLQDAAEESAGVDLSATEHETACASA